MIGVLSADDVARYHRDGFLPALPLLTPAETARFRDDCVATCGPQRLDGVHRQADNRVKPYLLFKWAADLVRHPRLLDMAESLIGPDILVFHTTLWWKDPGAGSFVPWHQDATYFGLDPHEHVTAWVALTPSTEASGCVRMIPGSHREGQLAHRDNPDTRAMLSRGQTIAREIPDDAGVPITVQPGEVTFHHTHLTHRSSPNTSKEPRIGVGISYIPAHVRHVGPVRLTASLVRGEDRYGHFDPEPVPAVDDDPVATAAHTESLARFRRASEAIPEMQGIH